ncbi:hypothetical protein BJY04DRAFT_221823 [Aspergillus karnatakaensis]|uniref:mannose-ethanolamine phosphotransferase LAS21 n=1 Tax=Aspergillus karnatakaensis TaxID=1810916 RepID=UPI003CCCC366
MANALIPVAILVFSMGFFPYKTLLPGLATFDVPQNAPPKIFDKVIFMVVDALRSLIRSGAAIPFTAYAGSPTVTMPRLKAITTGSVPSFLDVILNIAESDTSSTLVYQDTWLAQIKAREEKLIMYGDDTWLKLFPDTNVTRHVPNELSRADWSALIMHYLGLDHIGHKAGPQSSYMIPKQHEMDSVVTEVYTAIEQKEHLQSTLFVLCGDHGMNDAGNHGGSSAGETSPALLFISPKFRALKASRESPMDAAHKLQYYRVVDQTDITPTLAGLLGLPIPLNSLGVFIPEFLDMWQSGAQRVRLLEDNSRQLLRILKETYPAYSFGDESGAAACSSGSGGDMQQAHCAWSRVQQQLQQRNVAAGGDNQAEVESALLQFLHVAQEVMSGTASNYDLRCLLVGICVAGTAVLFCLPAVYKILSQHQHSGSFLTTSIILYGAMMFASSYVEEEQQFWYWILTGWTFYLHVRTFRKRLASESTRSYKALWSRAYELIKVGSLALAFSHRILRRWNQTGQKFAAEPDIARAYFPRHQGSLWTLVGWTYCDICLHLLSMPLDSRAWQSLCVLVTSTSFMFKLAFAASESPELLSATPLGSVATMLNRVSLVLSGRAAMGGICSLLLLSPFLARSSSLPQRRQVPPSTIAHEALTLFLINQSKITNIPIFLIYRLQSKILTSMNLTSVETTITSLLMQYAAFFAFGGSNAISSVDLSNAYNGINNYNVIMVGVLTYVGNWAGPIWWVSASQRLRAGRTWDKTLGHITLLTFYVTWTLLSVMAACTALRTHLFIWTVFSPKYLYMMSWAIIHHFAVNLFREIIYLLPPCMMLGD